jgi:hypothetical protein
MLAGSSVFCFFEKIETRSSMRGYRRHMDPSARHAATRRFLLEGGWEGPLRTQNNVDRIGPLSPMVRLARCAVTVEWGASGRNVAISGLGVEGEPYTASYGIKPVVRAYLNVCDTTSELAKECRRGRLRYSTKTSI